MENHLKAWRLHRILSAIYVLLLIVVGFLAFRRGGAVQLDTMLTGGLLVALALFHAWLGSASLARRPWARVASILMGFLLLLAFPIGTIIGYFLIAASWNPWTQPTTRGSPAASGWPSDAVRDRPRAGGR